MSKNREELRQAVQPQQRVYGQRRVAGKAHLFDNIAYYAIHLGKGEDKDSMHFVSPMMEHRGCVMGAVPIERVYQQIAQFAREAGARRVILFGSRAKGTNYPKSDIDLAIEGCPDFASFVDRLQEDLWSLLRLDIVNLDGEVSEELRQEIMRDGKVLYEEV